MEYTTLGSTGLFVSQLCLGTDRFSNWYEGENKVETEYDEALEILNTAYDLGINFIDTSNIYGRPNGTSEMWIGEWLETVDRGDIVIASKVGLPMGGGPNESGLSRKHVLDQIEGTLKRLGTEYVDIYYIHRWDDETPIRETIRTLNELVRRGKVRYLGISTTAAWKLTKSLWMSDSDGIERFEVTQPRFNAVHRGEIKDYLDVCRDQDLAVCPYSPLEGGFLTGKYTRSGDIPSNSRADFRDWYDLESYSGRQWDVLDTIREIADTIDATPAQVALKWLIDQEDITVVPIIGAGSTDHLAENVSSVETSLDENHRKMIDESYAK